MKALATYYLYCRFQALTVALDASLAPRPGPRAPRGRGLSGRPSKPAHRRTPTGVFTQPRPLAVSGAGDLHVAWDRQKARPDPKLLPDVKRFDSGNLDALNGR